MNRITAIQAALLSILCATIISCGGSGASRVSSNDVPTSSIYAAMEVVSDIDGSVFVSTQLKHGGATSDTYIDISDDERLVASLGKRYTDISVGGDLFSRLSHFKQEHKEMDQASQYWGTDYGLVYIDLPRTWYKAEFVNADVNQRIYISFDRKNQADANDSYVDLPEAYSITTPLSGNGALYSRSTDDITVEWAPSGSGANVTIDVLASCENDDSDSWQLNLSSDTGNATIPSSAISNMNGLCSYVIKVKKVNLGNFDARFGGGGIIQGTQVRSVAINTTD